MLRKQQISVEFSIPKRLRLRHHLVPLNELSFLNGINQHNPLQFRTVLLFTVVLRCHLLNPGPQFFFFAFTFTNHFKFKHPVSITNTYLKVASAMSIMMFNFRIESGTAM